MLDQAYAFPFWISRSRSFLLFQLSFSLIFPSSFISLLCSEIVLCIGFIDFSSSSIW